MRRQLCCRYYARACLLFHSVDALKRITLTLITHRMTATELIMGRIIIRTIRITVIMAERITMEIEATDYFSFPQVNLPTDLSITPRWCDCHALAFCRSMESSRHGLLADA